VQPQSAVDNSGKWKNRAGFRLATLWTRMLLLIEQSPLFIILIVGIVLLNIQEPGGS
jgi:hypothetical protein